MIILCATGFTLREVLMKYFNRDNAKIYYKEWSCASTPKAVILIVHGMAEHISRYSDFANFLNKGEIDVLGMDLRAHGQTGSEMNSLGHFANDDWNNILKDIEYLLNIKKDEYHKKYGKNIPFFILGHSMGSFITRNFINEYDAELSGIIIMGTGNADNPVLYNITRLITTFGEKKKIAKFVHKSAFKSNNDKISNPKTTFDWLSTDTNEVKKYIEDSFCGMYMTNGFYNEFMKGMQKISKLEKKNLHKKTLADTPILFISGKDDPVGGYGKFVESTREKYIRNGSKETSLILYDGMRHEVLNEKDRARVYSDIKLFIEKFL